MPGNRSFFAAALPPPGPVALVLQDGQGYWTCTPTGAPPRAISCAQRCATVAGVSAVAYDASGTLWIAAGDGLHQVQGTTCPLVAASTEPLRLVATFPGQSGKGAVYVTGTSHSFVYR